jgi:hypothetical protein
MARSGVPGLRVTPGKFFALAGAGFAGFLYGLFAIRIELKLKAALDP